MDLDLVISAAVVLGLIAIATAVVYVGRQIKAASSQEVVSSNDKRNHAMLGFRKLLLSDPGYVDIWRCGQSGGELDDVDQIIYNQLFFEYWHAQQQGYLRGKEADDQWSLDKARQAVMKDQARLQDVLKRLRVGNMLHPAYDEFLGDIMQVAKIEGASSKSETDDPDESPAARRRQP